MKAHGVLFLGEKFVRFTTPQDVEPVARYIAKARINEQGFKFNHKGRMEWLQSEVDYANEISEDGDIYTLANYLDTAVSDLFYNNAPHIIGAGNKQVSNDFVNECIEVICDLFVIN